jgi:hypothetical protein
VGGVCQAGVTAEKESGLKSGMQENFASNRF